MTETNTAKNADEENDTQAQIKKFMHDIRTPLQAAKLRTELLLLDCSDSELEAQLNGIIESIEDAVVLVNNHGNQ